MQQDYASFSHGEVLVEQKYLLLSFLFMSSQHQAVLDLILHLLDLVQLKLSSLAVEAVVVEVEVQVV